MVCLWSLAHMEGQHADQSARRPRSSSGDRATSNLGDRKQDLDDCIIWWGLAPQSRDAMRPQIQVGASRLAEMGVTKSPLRPRLPWWSFEAAKSHNLINLWPLQSGLVRDKDADYEIRNLVARLGAGFRAYKP